MFQKYRCHKVVEAFKIKHVLGAVGENLIIGDGVNVCVTNEWMEKHQPEVGGYFVRDEDGCESYSPASAFEGGYKLVKRERKAKADAVPVV